MKKPALVIAGVFLIGFVAWQFFGQGGLTHEAQCKSYGGSGWVASENLCIMGMIQSNEKKWWCRRAGGRYNNCYVPECSSEKYDCPAVCSTSCSF